MSHHNGVTLIREVRPKKKKKSFPLTEIERERLRKGSSVSERTYRTVT